MSKLVIEFGLDPDKDAEIETHLTQLSIPLPDGAAEQAAEVIVALADQMDQQPGDADVDFSTTIKVPVLKVAGRTIKFSLPVGVNIRLVEDEKPAEPDAEQPADPVG